MCITVFMCIYNLFFHVTGSSCSFYLFLQDKISKVDLTLVFIDPKLIVYCSKCSCTSVYIIWHFGLSFNVEPESKPNQMKVWDCLVDPFPIEPSRPDFASVCSKVPMVFLTMADLWLREARRVCTSYDLMILHSRKISRWVLKISY